MKNGIESVRVAVHSKLGSIAMQKLLSGRDAALVLERSARALRPSNDDYEGLLNHNLKHERGNQDLHARFGCNVSAAYPNDGYTNVPSKFRLTLSSDFRFLR